MDEITIIKTATLINTIYGVIRDLRKRRIHPMDIIPSENPERIAKRLEEALNKYSNE